jgi:hypothetical protein
VAATAILMPFLDRQKKEKRNGWMDGWMDIALKGL